MNTSPASTHVRRLFVFDFFFVKCMNNFAVKTRIPDFMTPIFVVYKYTTNTVRPIYPLCFHNDFGSSDVMKNEKRIIFN